MQKDCRNCKHRSWGGCWLQGKPIKNEKATNCPYFKQGFWERLFYGKVEDMIDWDLKRPEGGCVSEAEEQSYRYAELDADYQELLDKYKKLQKEHNNLYEEYMTERNRNDVLLTQHTYELKEWLEDKDNLIKVKNIIENECIQKCGIQVEELLSNCDRCFCILYKLAKVLFKDNKDE